MLAYLRDQFATLGLRARYQRIVQEKLLDLAESGRRRPVSEESTDWQLLGGKHRVNPAERAHVRDRAREFVRENPYACNILRLLEAYVTGPGLALTHQPTAEPEGIAKQVALIEAADRLWEGVLRHNCRHYSFREHARRTWRDGECFVRKFSSGAWPPDLRFVDPERVVASPDAPETQGIVTTPHDVEKAVMYLVARTAPQDPLEQVSAEDMLQTRLGVDSNEKRGLSLFAPILETLERYDAWLETEMLARKLQSSIVLWRKVQGSGSMADALGEQAAGQTRGGGSRERFTPGSILTTNHSTDIQFLQPNTNFGDAVPLGRLLLLSVAAGAGLPEFMLTADASNANFASTMVAEGPAVKFFQSEQQFFAAEFARIWRWVMQDGIERGLLPEDFFEQVAIRWSFPQLINRDRPRERMADVQLVRSGVLSRAEVARRDGVDPRQMQSESQAESRETPAPKDQGDAGPGRA